MKSMNVHNFWIQIHWLGYNIVIFYLFYYLGLSSSTIKLIKYTNQRVKLM
jgi:hypothetical protein